MISDDKPIVSAACYAPGAKGISAWIKNTQISMQYTQKLLHVDMVGLAFCLIKREVFEKAMKMLGTPLFYFDVNANWDLTKPEDTYFFEKIRKIGYRPWIDLRAKVIHLRSVGLTAEGSILAALG